MDTKVDPGDAEGQDEQKESGLDGKPNAAPLNPGSDKHDGETEEDGGEDGMSTGEPVGYAPGFGYPGIGARAGNEKLEAQAEEHQERSGEGGKEMHPGRTEPKDSKGQQDEDGGDGEGTCPS